MKNPLFSGILLSLTLVPVFTSTICYGVETAFPVFDNVVYTEAQKSTLSGSIPFTKCRVNDPSMRHFQSMECGFFVVNENPGDADSRKIKLFVGRMPATGKKVQEDPLLVFEGGPGGASSETFIFPGRGLDKIRRQRDIYIVDQRGTGKSARLGCPAQEAIVDYSPELARQLTRECLRQLDAEPQYYTTSLAIQDFEELRKALGISQWNLYGISYGTRVAQHYLRRFPNAIRTVTLDGVVYPEHNLGPDIALESQLALEQLIARCKADGDCQKAYPDLEQGVNRLFRQLASGAVQLDVVDSLSGEKISSSFTQRHLMFIVRMSLYSPATMAILPLLLHQAYAENNFLPLVRNTEMFGARMESALAIGMHNSVICAEDVAFIDRTALNHKALDESYMGRAVIDALFDICSLWPSGPVDQDFKQALDSDKPVLLLSGSVDPITPPAYAEQAKKGLSNSLHLVVEGFGHGVAGVGCMPALLANFVADASFDYLDTGCLQKQTPDPFFIDFNGPTP